jgi:eukaryotic-like serine/threonine-protein kinase
MTVRAGTRIGPYEVTAPIGAGGMGEVYRAHDSKLNRDVALKVLPDAFALDQERLARFTREAQVLAALNHPYIAAIYGFEDAGPVHALVLEFVDGPTLAERIEQGALPVDEALPIARQIAEALEAAHEHGIIHRDLKPANIKLTADGNVKVLDFGLAKLADTPDAAATGAGLAALSQSPTLTTPAMTGIGVILGTAAYMAPEQAKGRAADKRADVWAYGCVLYEMLTGRSPFQDDDVSDTLANVLKREPDWSVLPNDLPPAVRAVIRRCLEKDRRRRIADVAAAIFALEEAKTLGGASGASVPAPESGRSRFLWRVAMPVVALIVGAALARTALSLRTPVVEAPEMRFDIATPPTDRGGADFALSPDGSQIVFRAANDRRMQLWLRRLASDSSQPLPGTDSPLLPFWSPDSRSIGFFADQKLKRIDIADSRVQVLADTTANQGAAWGSDNILFMRATTAPLFRVSPTGSQPPVEATKLDSPRVTGHRYPRFLPDGRRFLFFATGTSEGQGLYLGSLDSPDARRLVETDRAGAFLPPDWVLFGRDEALYAQRLDLQGLRMLGEPILISERVASAPGLVGNIALSAASTGAFAYRNTGNEVRELVWFDRMGRQDGTLGAPEGLELAMQLSPDARTVAINRRVNGNLDIWLVETARALPRRLTLHTATDAEAAWSPDGRRIAFNSTRKTGGIPNNLYIRSIDTGTEEVLLESDENKSTQDWSPDGRFILYRNQNAKTGMDLWALPLEGDRKPFAVAQTGFVEDNAHFSPDGRWILYQSTETGRAEVFVQPFPGPGRSWQISTNGGIQGRWRGDGREIFYLAPDNRMTAVSVTLNAGGPTVDAGTPVALFPLRPGSTYDVTRDGQRFLINTVRGDAPTPPITVVLNWKPPAR